MLRNTAITIPTLVRIKQGALDRIGIYISRLHLQNVVVLFNTELDQVLIQRVDKSMNENGISVLQHIPVRSSSLEHAQEIFQSLPRNTNAIVAFGGGKALDVAKYVAFLGRLPYIASPTSLSNDGFCSPQSSLEYQGKRRSFPSAMPYGVVIDTLICLNAPQILWHSGIGDLVAKITAVHDWKLSSKKNGTQIDDFAALLSDATVFQLMAKPDHDIEGIRLLSTALMLNGISMEICGSSRPASGSEHLISHALDLISKRPRLHGLQVGIATYIVSQIQGQGTDRITQLFDATGFWKTIENDPFDRNEWIEACKAGPSVKPDYYTILSEKDSAEKFIQIINQDSRLRNILVSTY
ncbi:MAG: iron-containing alcohol dehydrogenase family protein [Endomicrobiales bacterium]